MTPEAAKLLQAELGDTVQWWLGSTNMSEWKTLDFNSTGLYSYKLKVKPPRRTEPPLVWPDLECVHEWVQTIESMHQTCIYCKKIEAQVLSKDQTEALEEAIAICNDALHFYAEPSNYKSPSQGFAAQYDPEPSLIQNDAGKRARNVIGAAGLELKKAKPYRANRR